MRHPLRLLILFACLAVASTASAQVRQNGATQVECVSGCSGGTTDTDDGSVAGAQSIGLGGSLNYAWDGAVWKRVTFGTYLQVECASGCSGGTTDTDDASVATGQSTGLNIGLTHVYDGSVWRRLTIGTAGTASAQVLTVQGIAAMTPLITTNTAIGATTDAAVPYDTNGTVIAQLRGIGVQLGDSLGTLSLINGQTPALGNGATDAGTLRVTLSNDSTGQVKLAAGAAAIGSVTVSSGTVTANAGTNLNTSLLALESGGNLATVAGAIKAEDGLHASGETGILALCVRKTSATDLSAGGTDGDREPCQVDANGRLYAEVTGSVVSVSGSSVSISGGSLAANQSVNVAQINGVTPLMGAGNTGTGSPRVTISTDQAALVGLGVYVEDVAETAGGNLSMSGTVRRDTAASSATTAGDNATVNTDANGFLWARVADPCSALTKTYFPVNIVTATTTQIAAAVASQYYYICAINLFSAGTQSAVIVEDDTNACASPTAGLNGGTTAGTGYNFTAQTGISQGNGNGSIMRTAAQNRYICIITSAAVQLSGHVVVVAAP